MNPSVRSRTLHPSLANGIPIDYRHHAETELVLDELRSVKLKRSDGNVFSDSRYYTMSEKGLRSLCTELARLKEASANQMCESVYAIYGAFIRTSQEWLDIEGEIVNMRNVLSQQAALVHGLKDGLQLDIISDKVDVASEGVLYSGANRMALQDSEVLLDNLDVLIAERRVDEALAALFDGEATVMDMSEDDQAGESFRTQLQVLLSERKARLAEQLVDVVQQPSTSGHELRAAITTLYRLGDGPRAHSLLLNAHRQKLHSNVRGLRSSCTCYGGEYTFTLSQLVFSTLSQAAKDSRAIFGEQAAYISELVLWVSNEVANFASLVERQILLPASASGSLHAAAESVQTALGYCSLLEDEGLTLCPALSKLFRPSVEKTLEANVMHMKEALTVAASVDDWEVSLPSGSSGVSHLKLSSSAQKFQKLVQDFFEDAAPLINMQLGGFLQDTSAHLLDFYVDILMKAIPKPRFDTSSVSKLVILAETEHQQLGLWANASAFAEEILPREEARKRGTATSRGAELREWRRRLQRSVDRLRDLYCGKQVLDLFFNEDGLPNFGADMYTLLEDDTDNSQLMPSPVFQELFFKLNKLSNIAGDVLAGRERTSALLLSKLVEAFVIFLLEEQGFWEGIDDGTKPLGQAGLQQFVLDLYFVIQIATHGHYSTRKIRTVVLEIINRAMESFNADGLDPDSILPENEWFLEVAAGCIPKLLPESSA
eukprot:c19160_g1_i1 orf=582-2723(-)